VKGDRQPILHHMSGRVRQVGSGFSGVSQRAGGQRAADALVAILSSDKPDLAVFGADAAAA